MTQSVSEVECSCVDRSVYIDQAEYEPFKPDQPDVIDSGEASSTRSLPS
jgi:hypothetical protein